MPDVCPHIKSCPKRSSRKDCLHWLAFPMRKEADPINAPGVYQYDCAYNWTARFQFESAQRILGAQAAIESMRNETVKRQDVALALAAQNGRLLNADGQD